MSHPDEGLIHAWLDGELDADESARVEALVASDSAWAAAAAEARGLMAASARIVGALDRVPANVIPKIAAPPRRATRQWMLRAAAVVVLLGGSAVVLQRTALDSVGIAHVDVPVNAPVAAPVNAPVNAPVAAPAAMPVTPQIAKAKSSVSKKELVAEKQDSALRDKDVATRLAEARPSAAASVATGGVERRADAAANAAARPAAAPAAMNFSQAEKTTRLSLSCFEQRVPPARGDSANRIIRLAAAALDDSIRFEKLTLRGDTLAAVNGPLIAVRVRCPAQ